MSPHRELRLAPPLAPAKFRLSQVPGDTIPQGWSGPALSEVTDDPGSGGVTPPRHTGAQAHRSHPPSHTGAQAHRSHPPGTQAHLPELSSQTILLGVGQRWGGGLISNILRILAPSLRVLRLISSTLSKSHDSNRFAQIRLLEEKEGRNCFAFSQIFNGKGTDSGE